MIKIGKDIRRFSAYSCQPKTKDELDEIIKSRIDENSYECDLNDIDVSLIPEMSYLFYKSKFNGNISNWNVSKVENMSAMFYNSKFNQDISKWDVSNVKDMSHMFIGSKFSGDISNWKINKKCDINFMFYNCPIQDEFKPKSLKK